MSGVHGILKRLHSKSVGYDMADPGDAGNIAPDRQFCYVSLETAGAETRTLEDPLYAGQRLTFGFKVDAGDCVITADSAINQTGNTIMTFADIGDHLELVGIEDDDDSLEWRVVANDGVALS